MKKSAITKWRLMVCIMATLAIGLAAWAANEPAPQLAKAKKVAREGKPKTNAPATQPAEAKAQPDKAGKPDKAAETAKPNIAHMTLRGQVLSSPPGFTLLGGQNKGTTLREWLLRLGKARNDDEVDAVALEIDSPSMIWAQAQELADAVHRLNEVKPVYAHITAGSASHYLVASAAKEVAMDPAGELMITGLAAEMTFFRGTLDAIGIEPQLFQIGRFKGAAEPMMRTGPSDELKGEYDKILDDLYNQFCGQIACQRKLTIPHVRYAVDNGPFDGKSAKEYRLIDGLVERAQWKQHVANKVIGGREITAMWRSKYGAKPARNVNSSNPFALLGALMGKKTDTSTKDPTVAIIHADGVIVDGTSGSSFFGGKMVGDKTLTTCFNEVADDDNVKAVIFRIDSPGGSALASEMIYQAVAACAKKKPVIASIVGVGGSGGYYIAVAANRIIADPSAITGSIGVVGGKLATTGLMNKLGISTYEITRGQNAGLWTSRAWNEREQKLVKDMMEATYRKFTGRVKQGRGDRIKDIDKVAQGRIFTARQALANGLIDEVGGLREALAAAQKAAGIESSHIIVLPRPKTLADILSGDSASASMPIGANSAVLRTLLEEAPAALAVSPERMEGIKYLLTLGQLLGKRCVLTAMPYHVNIEP